MKKIKTVSRAYGCVIVCFSFMMFFFIYSALHKGQLFSDTENRQLQQRPAFSTTSFTDKNFQKDMESYASDQFFKRSSLVEMKTKIEKKMGKTSFHDVFVGKQNILFQKRVVPDTTRIHEVTGAINAFTKAHKKQQVSMLLIPNKGTIWEKALPWSAANQNQVKDIQNVHTLLDKRITWIDAIKPLQQHKQEYIYYRNDHHWTTLGAAYVFEQYRQQIVKQSKAIPYTMEPIQQTFYGSLAKQSGDYQGKADIVSIPVMKNLDYIVSYEQEQKKTTTIYEMKKIDTNNPYDVFLEGNHPLVTIQTTSEKKGNLLVIKDSYANSFIPFLLPYYQSITIVDPRYYYDSIETLIKDRKIQDVVFIYNANTFFQDSSLSDMLQAQN